MVVNAVFEGNEISGRLNSLACKFLFEYWQEATARKHFLNEVNKYIDSIGTNRVIEFFETEGE